MPILFSLPPEDIESAVYFDKGALVFSTVGSTEARCPYCRTALKKLPSRRTQCKDCGKFMMKRTRHSTGEAVVATELDAALIDVQNAVRQSGPDVILRWQTIWSQARGALQVKGTATVTQEAIEWEILEQDLRANKNYADRGAHRNTLAEMAARLADAEPHRALPLFIQVLCWDMVSTPEIDAWSVDTPIEEVPHCGDMAVSHLQDVVRLASHGSLDDTSLGAMFAAQMAKVRSIVRAAPSDADVWKEFRERRLRITQASDHV